MKTNLIIVIGQPCTGKTTFSRLLSQELCIPYFSKDYFKETLFDELGYSDRDWSKKVNNPSYKFLYEIADQLLRTKYSVILDSNFNSEIDSPKIENICKKNNCQAIQIIFQTDGQILFERFKKRSESNERHPGHCDHNNYDEFKKKLLKGSIDQLNIDSKILKIDTTDFEKVDFKQVIDEVKTLLT